MLMKPSRHFLLVAAGIAFAMSSGCVKEIEQREELGVGVIAELPEYPQLARYKLSLKLVSDRTLTAGKPGRVTFSLRKPTTARSVWSSGTPTSRTIC